MIICKPIDQSDDESANRCNFLNAFTCQNKTYNSFQLTVYMSALFLQITVYGNDEAHKKFSSENIIF